MKDETLLHSSPRLCVAAIDRVCTETVPKGLIKIQVHCTLDLSSSCVEFIMILFHFMCNVHRFMTRCAMLQQSRRV